MVRQSSVSPKKRGEETHGAQRVGDTTAEKVRSIDEPSIAMEHLAHIVLQKRRDNKTQTVKLRHLDSANRVINTSYIIVPVFKGQPKKSTTSKKSSRRLVQVKAKEATWCIRRRSEFT